MKKYSKSRCIKITIRGELPSMNEYSKAQRTNAFVGAKMKQEATEIVHFETLKQMPKKFKMIETPSYFVFEWYCKNERKDPDNVASAKKFILDGFQTAGLIKNDNWNGVLGFEDYFTVDKSMPKIVISIYY